MSNALEKFTPKDIIRTETALSRFPVHRLSKKGNINIAIKITKPTGEIKTRWKVSYNSEYGQPSPLAYKIDTLIINRRIEEEGKPTPKLIRLGSLNEICRELGINDGQGVKQTKNALLQNVGALITAKFSYKTTSGEERTVEIADTRYGIIFTGEKLPSGDKADAVHIVLHDIYREILNNAQNRPLDYDYMRELTPAAQRFYELLSYQIYAALKNRTAAKMLYSEFCTYMPQTRYTDWEHVKKQVYKLHRPHLASQYIKSISFEKMTGADGQPDWLMIYIPGERAEGQHIAFQRKPPMPRIRHRERNEKQFSFLPEEKPEPLPEAVLGFSPEEENLVSKLKEYGVGEKKARELVKTKREAADVQIAAYPYRGTKPTKNAAGWLVTAIEQNFTLPVAYLEEKNKESRAAATKNRADAEQDKAAAIAACQFCDSIGWRRIKTEQYPTGAMKRCGHDPKEESKFQSAN